jgi:hypothetical protein
VLRVLCCPSWLDYLDLITLAPRRIEAAIYSPWSVMRRNIPSTATNPSQMRVALIGFLEGALE